MFVSGQNPLNAGKGRPKENGMAVSPVQTGILRNNDVSGIGLKMCMRVRSFRTEIDRRILTTVKLLNRSLYMKVTMYAYLLVILTLCCGVLVQLSAGYFTLDLVKSHHGRMSGKKLELCRDRRLSGQRPVKSKVLCVRNIHRSEEQTDDTRGVSRIFERGGSNISWFPKKKSSGFKRGGSNGQMGGGPVH